MHSSEPALAASKQQQQPASGVKLLHQLGELIIKGRQQLLDPRAAKLKAAAVPSSSRDNVTYVDPEKSPRSMFLEKQLRFHAKALMSEQIPLSIEVLLAPSCSECSNNLSTLRDELPSSLLLLERWTLSVIINKSHETPAFITSQWLQNAIRSQIHFSQISAWLSKLQALNKETPAPTQAELDPKERQRKLSRETCNFKKLEANCDESDLPDFKKPETQKRSLNVVYAFKIPGETFKTKSFNKPPTNHTFPITDIGSNAYLKVVLETLPRSEEIPQLRCNCQMLRRRSSKDLGSHEELAVRMSSLTLGPPEKNDKPFKNPEYNKMSMLCSTNNLCPKANVVQTNFALVDDRMHTPCSESGKHRCSSLDDESDGLKPGCSKVGFDKRLKEMAKQRRRLRKESELRKMLSDSVSDSSDNQPATSIPILQASRFDRLRTFGYRVGRKESPKVEMVSIATQTDSDCLECGEKLEYDCFTCLGKTKRNDLYDEDDKSLKKHKCDTRYSFNFNVKRPKLRQYPSIYNKLENVMRDRRKASDILDLSLNKDDSVFDLDRMESVESNPDCSIPSTSEMDGFRLRLDSAASMVFHTKTGLPLTSSPAPIRKGKSCFDYDSTITNISGIKSALCHPDVSPLRGTALSMPPRTRKTNRANTLLGSFEESVLKGRLEPAATVDGFTAELGASGAFCPSHVRLPVTVFFYALGGTNAPYLGHINLGSEGYHVPRSGTIQVSLLNPHGTLVKMFVVLYDLSDMPAGANTFLRQRTMHVSSTGEKPTLAYLIHLRFMTSNDGKLYLHTDIRMIVSKKADLDTGTALTSLKTTNGEHIIKQNPSKNTSEPFIENDSSNQTNDSGYNDDDSLVNDRKTDACCSKSIIFDALNDNSNHSFDDSACSKNDSISTENGLLGTKDSCCKENGLCGTETSLHGTKNSCCNENGFYGTENSLRGTKNSSGNEKALCGTQHSLRSTKNSCCKENCICGKEKSLCGTENSICGTETSLHGTKNSCCHENGLCGTENSLCGTGTILQGTKESYHPKSNGVLSSCVDFEFMKSKRKDRSEELSSDCLKQEVQKKLEYRPLPSYELRSYTISPENPKYSLR